MEFFQRKLILAMKNMFILMALLIVKIATLGVQRTHIRLSKNKFIVNAPLFGEKFGA